MARSLIQLLTEDQLLEIVERFYDAVYRDALLAPIFVNVERGRQVQRLAAFVRMTARPGSEMFDGPYLRGAHDHLDLSDALFDHRHALLIRAVRACGHGEDIVAAWDAYDARWRSWVLGGAARPPEGGAESLG